MGRCLKCNSVLDEGAKFCAVCGTPVAIPQQAMPQPGPAQPAPQPSPAPAQPINQPAPAQPMPQMNQPAPAQPMPQVNQPAPAQPMPQMNQPAPAPMPQMNQPMPGQPAPQMNQGMVPPQPAVKPAPAPKPPKKPISLSPEKVKLFKWIGIGSLAAAGLFLVLFGVMMFFGGKAKQSKQYGFYLKDNELYTIDGKGKAQEVTSRYYEYDSNAGNLNGTIYRDGNYVYFTDRSNSGLGNLSRVNLKNKDDKVKIDSDVNYTYVIPNSNFSKCVYVRDGAVYRADLKRGEKEKIATVSGMFALSTNLENFAYIDDEDRLYVKYGKQDKVKVGDDVEFFTVGAENFNSGTEILYTTYDEEDDIYTLYSYRNGTNKELMESDMCVGYLYNNGKGYITSYDDDEEVMEIYYYDGKTQVLAAEISEDGEAEMHGISAEKTNLPAMVYSDEDGEKHILVERNDILLSSIDSEDDVYGVTFSNDGKKVLIKTSADGSDTTSYLFSIQKSGSSYKLVQDKIIDNIGSYSFTKDNKLVYLMDYDYDESCGSLYVDSTYVAADVNRFFISNNKSGKTIYYLADYSTSDNAGTLYAFSGKKKKMISSDVHGAIALNDGGIYYMYDYSSKHGYGDLCYYKSGRPVKVNTEVEDYGVSTNSQDIRDSINPYNLLSW